MPGSRVRVPPLLFGAAARRVATRLAGALAALAGVAAIGACETSRAPRPAVAAPVFQEVGDSVLVVAVGDLVCGSATPEGIPCLAARTAALVRQLQPAALLLLGDLQYETGSLDDFGAYFEPTFGELKPVIRPVPGNHEYFTPGAAGYFDYFNGAGNDSGTAGHRARGYYSFDVGGWHVVALNSNCREAGGCNARSPQARWLQADLEASRARCTIAFMHAARFSSGEHGNADELRDLWDILHRGGVEIALAGHDHSYERFSPQDALGRSDARTGIRAFVVGTGGKGTGRILRPRPHSEVRDNRSIGVLTLALRNDSYTWRFAPVPGFTLADSGSGRCHDAPGR